MGDFLVFLDADCTIKNPNDFFELALSNFEKNKNLVALTGYIKVLPELETVSDQIILWIMNFVVRINNNVFHKGDSAGGEFQMVRKDAFDSVNGYREDLVTREDRDLFNRLSKTGRTMSDPNLVIFHTGRRFHKVGWLRLIGLFFINTIYFHIKGKVLSKEWKVVR
jgi:GT2 family glycosyltransferase